VALEPVEGQIVFDDDARPFSGASVELTLEDTTYADAPAVPVARLVLPSVSYDGEPGGGVPFALTREPVAPGRRQTLRVLVDLDGDGRAGPGDYRNAESVAVPAGPVRGLQLRVRRIV
jgi:hypothetical protein